MSVTAPDLALYGDEKTCLDDGSLTTLDLTGILVTMNDDALNALRTSVAGGDHLTLHTGSSPRIELGNGLNSVPLNLKVALEQFRHEIYTSKSASSRLDFRTLITQRADCQVDQSHLAMQGLRSSMAAIAEEQDAKKATFNDAIIDTKRKRMLNPVCGTPTWSRATSTARSPDGRSTPLAPSPVDRRQKAMTKVVTHLLAARPLSDQDIFELTRVPTKDRHQILQKVASHSPQTNLWTLRDRAYKDVRVWEFKYTRASEREAAIEAAVRAYDRLRLGKGDDLWQSLLIKEERHKGKVLSRLHSSATQKANPSTRPTSSSAGTPVRSGTPQHDTGKDSPSLTSVNGAARTSPVTSQPMKRQISGMSDRSNLAALLKGSKKSQPRAPTSTKEIKEPSNKEPSKAGAKYKSTELVSPSDDDDDAVSSASSVTVITAAKTTTKVLDPATIRKTAQEVARSTVRGGSSASLLAIEKPIIKSLGKRSAGATPVHGSSPVGRAEKRPVKGNVENDLTRSKAAASDRDHKPRVPAAGSSARNGASTPTATSAAPIKRQGPIVPKQKAMTPVAGVQGTVIEPVCSSKKRECPEPSYEGTARPRKANKIADATTTVQTGSRAQRNNTGLTSQRSEPSLKRKADAISRGGYDDYDRQRARKQGRADSSSVTSAATAHSVTTALTSRASPVFSAPSPVSTEGSRTSNSSHEMVRAGSSSSGGSLTSSNNGHGNGGYTSKFTWERALDEAERFKTQLFPAYTALFDRLSSKATKDVKPEELRRLHDMHNQLKRLKQEIYLACP